MFLQIANIHLKRKNIRMSVPEQDRPKKSRHLSIFDLFETLQIEFIVAELRHKTYPRIKDKIYWKKVMDGKKASIEKIAEKNSLPTIFTDQEKLREFEKKVYRDQSYPIYVYKNEENRQTQEYFDLQYYYYPNSEVRVQLYEETRVGKITREFIPYKDNYVWVTVKGKEEKHPITNVTRIL